MHMDTVYVCGHDLYQRHSCVLFYVVNASYSEFEKNRNNPIMRIDTNRGRIIFRSGNRTKQPFGHFKHSACMILKKYWNILKRTSWTSSKRRWYVKMWIRKFIKSLCKLIKRFLRHIYANIPRCRLKKPNGKILIEDPQFDEDLVSDSTNESTESEYDDEHDNVKMIEYLSIVLGVSKELLLASTEAELNTMIVEFRTHNNRFHKNMLEMV